MSWLWKSDTSSPASFEKALSKLSSQITKEASSLEATRSRGRRLKALWTLYTTLTFLVFLLILFLVIGPQNWSIPQYAGIVGGPTVIYGVRLAISSLYDWRAGRQRSHLDHLQKQREGKIAELKKATRYDSTQELLQKYGGVPSPKHSSTERSPPKEKPISKEPATHAQRTGLAPPPTANIVKEQSPQSPLQPPFSPHEPRSSRASMISQPMSPRSPVSPDEPGFAPNAFNSMPFSPATYEQAPHWYDRVLDVMLGEDENLAKNRLVLLCQNCRLVNGRAPPGVKNLEELGKWRCGSCGAWNGAESESARVVKDIMKQPKENASEEWQQVSRGDESGHSEAQDLPPRTVEDTGISTGKEQNADVSFNKRVTRSSGEEPLEGL